jgi:hypothetical protein
MDDMGWNMLKSLIKGALIYMFLTMLSVAIIWLIVKYLL